MLTNWLHYASRPAAFFLLARQKLLLASASKSSLCCCLSCSDREQAGRALPANGIWSPSPTSYPVRHLGAVAMAAVCGRTIGMSSDIGHVSVHTHVERLL